MSDWNYAEVATRLETDAMRADYDYPAIMALLGYEVTPHRRTRFACRRAGSGDHLQSLPCFWSADDAELWIPPKVGGFWDDVGREHDGRVYAGFNHPEYGNDYGVGKRLGTAMWAAFVRLVAKVPAE